MVTGEIMQKDKGGIMSEILEMVEDIYGSGAAIAVADLLKEYDNEQ